jgi:hypothetical protein
MIKTIEGEKGVSVGNRLGDLLARASTKVTINSDNIPYVAYPIARFIEKEKPDYVIACDRGARIIALATHMLYQELYGTFPTRNHTIAFRKISRKMSPEIIRQQLEADMFRILGVVESPKIFVLDDWIFTGKTISQLRKIIMEASDRKAKVFFGVMLGRGEGIDISGDSNSFAFWDKRNKGDLVGVDYDSELIPFKTNSPEAIAHRGQLLKSVRAFARRISR